MEKPRKAASRMIACLGLIAGIMSAKARSESAAGYASPAPYSERMAGQMPSTKGVL